MTQLALCHSQDSVIAPPKKPERIYVSTFLDGQELGYTPFMLDDQGRYSEGDAIYSLYEVVPERIYYDIMFGVRAWLNEKISLGMGCAADRIKLISGREFIVTYQI